MTGFSLSVWFIGYNYFIVILYNNKLNDSGERAFFCSGLMIHAAEIKCYAFYLLKNNIFFSCEVC